MKNQSLRSTVFAAAMLVFVCLLISGSPRLIGSSGDSVKSMPVREICAVPAVLTANPVPRVESGCMAERDDHAPRKPVLTADLRQEPVLLVLSDANGNVLGQRSYVHEVYQTFALGDGFV